MLFTIRPFVIFKYHEITFLVSGTAIEFYFFTSLLYLILFAFSTLYFLKMLIPGSNYCLTSRSQINSSFFVFHNFPGIKFEKKILLKFLKKQIVTGTKAK